MTDTEAWIDAASRSHQKSPAVVTRTEGSLSDRVFCDVSISADGYLAGPDQTADQPFGDGPVDRLLAWMFDTPDENQAEADRITAAGAFVMGRNMFGPSRGDRDRSWRGWWGEDPPYHAPVFVLTHHPRDPLPMQGGATFRFVTDGVGAALEQARKAAGDRDVAHHPRQLPRPPLIPHSEPPLVEGEVN
jgi:dihydrofolate reductase